MRINFVTSNPGKVREALAALQPLGHEVVQVKMPYPEVQADTLDAVVCSALDWLDSKVEMPFFIDDSGLFINALGGFPGVYSSHAFKTLGCDGILRLLHGIEERAARFECCVGLKSPRDRVILKGTVEGEIAHEPRGSGGFGLDPIFVPSGWGETFAEMDTGTKNSISHRGRAFSALRDYLDGMR
ncbi:MAG: XTP/dITP diphosphatase [Candidatus Thermoplasmatota archaeon]